MEIFSDLVLSESFRQAFRIVYYAAFFIIPIFLLTALIKLWVTYIRLKFIKETDKVLLEIKLPKEILKSPAAMELFLTQLWNKSGAKHFIEAYWNGNIMPWYSLELVSTGGNVRFFIWTWAKNKDMVEAQIYAQYPEVEIYEVEEDYTASVYHDMDKFIMWGTYFKLSKPDPYPIKTYVDYGMNEDPKEEYKVDPMSSVIEYLGSLKPGEQAWIQILVKAHAEEGFTEGYLFPKKDWKDQAKKERKKLLEEFTPKEEDRVFRRSPLKTETGVIEAIDRSLSKFAFDTVIRAFYIAEKEVFKGSNIGGLIGTVKQYSSNTLNGFKLGWYTDFKYPWQDFKRHRRNKIEKLMLDAYKRRSIFYPPYRHFKQKPYVLTTEELATIFHFPGGVVSTPTVDRVPSRKAEAPANLPV